MKKSSSSGSISNDKPSLTSGPPSLVRSAPELIEKTQAEVVPKQIVHTSSTEKLRGSTNSKCSHLTTRQRGSGDSTTSTPIRSKEDKKKLKKYIADTEEVPSVFKDMEWRNQKFEHIPLLKTRKLKKNPKVLDSVTGPYDIRYPAEHFISWICGRSISTYPHLPGKPIRDGDPICDSYFIQLLEDNVVITVIADGCNWGRRPMEASNRARDAMVDYVKNHIHEVEDLRDVGHLLLKALSYCHFKIVEGKEDLWEAGTTTILGGLLVRIKDEHKQDKWAWVAVSVGDCKSFHYQAQKQEIIDITAGNRKNAYDARDPGGRLGPYVGDGEPDLRNLFVYFRICDEGDLILLFSDGVHDNLDPQTLGKSPKDVNPIYACHKDWKDFPTEAAAEEAKTEFMRKFLIQELILGGEEERKMRAKVFSHPTMDLDALSPENITNRIMKHCLDVTASGRQWMEQVEIQFVFVIDTRDKNPKDKLPNDYNAYPGKMDHATCVVVKVGRFDQALNKLSKNQKGNKKGLISSKG